MRHLAEKRDLHITFTNRIGDAVIQADRYCMSQVLGNLLDNAIKFTKEGTIAVTLYAGHDGQPCINITDTGIGMSPEYLETLFLPYTQEMVGHTRAYEGIGLGLALVHRYLEMHGMDIRVSSEKGAGTTFTIDTGRTVAQPQRVVPAPPPAAPDQDVAVIPDFPDPTVKRLLVVEDDAQTREYMAYLLGSEYDMVLVDSREPALLSIAERRPDLILMDLSLQAGINGLDIVRELRADTTTASIPVIAVTAHAFPADQQRCLEAGCNGYLAKPVQKRQLRDAIESCLKPPMGGELRAGSWELRAGS
jgi:CheY-like chemotaxis protein